MHIPTTQASQFSILPKAYITPKHCASFCEMVKTRAEKCQHSAKSRAEKCMILFESRAEKCIFAAKSRAEKCQYYGENRI